MNNSNSNRRAFLAGILSAFALIVLWNGTVNPSGFFGDPNTFWRVGETINWIHSGWNIGANSVSAETLSATDTIHTRGAFTLETINTQKRNEYIESSSTDGKTYVYRIETIDELSSINLLIDGIEYPTGLVAAASATEGDPVRIAWAGDEWAFDSVELER